MTVNEPGSGVSLTRLTVPSRVPAFPTKVAGSKQNSTLCQALVRTDSHRGVWNGAIAPSFFDLSWTLRSPLPRLVTSMVSSPRIDFNSLWILKGDLSATFADPFELITINFLNGDQPAKGDMFISVGRSSAFLLLATETAQTSCHLARLLRLVGIWEG
ncbi:hypothetical protein PoB_006771700 [Plakobranchus ocellatus]|uniref:Uncharacterized protein n=1 Tax=Plakobranchus ocellatus TaxID=259542 RepID=A0AAV4DB02_9GAST|nr:hypothetical protein PoB_006771700 [Plakobranchus ocellatus]